MPDGALEPIETNSIEKLIQKCHDRCLSNMWVSIPDADVVASIVEHYGEGGSAFSVSLHTKENTPFITFPSDFFTALENIYEMLDWINASLVGDKHTKIIWEEHFHDEAHQVMWAIGFFNSGIGLDEATALALELNEVDINTDEMSLAELKAAHRKAYSNE